MSAARPAGRAPPAAPAAPASAPREVAVFMDNANDGDLDQLQLIYNENV